MGSSLSTRHSSLSTVVGGCAADYTLFLAVMAALAAALVLAREVNYGPGLNADSMWHISAGQQLAAGEGLVNSKGDPYVGWPPLYPSVLAAASGLTGLYPRDVAGPLNAAFFALTVFVAGRWLRRRLASRFLAAWAVAALALAVPLVDAASWAMSEMLFILVTTLALIHADAFLAAGKTRSLAAVAAYGALAWQARYIGVAVPFFVGLLLLCRAEGGGGFPRRVKQAAAVWLSAGLSIAPWMLRNYLLSGKFTGNYRWAYDYPLSEVLRDIGATLWRWLSFELPAIGLQPPELLSLRPLSKYDYLQQSMGGLQPPELFSLAGGVWTAAAVAAAGYVLLRFPWKKQILAAWRPLWVFGGFALTYIALFSAAAVLEYSDSVVRPRYVAPAYIPLLTAAALALDRLGRAGRGSRPRVASRRAAAAAAAALCLWTAGQAAPHARRIVRANAGNQDGDLLPGLSAEPRWAASETLRYVSENTLDGAVYSNRPLMPLAIHNANAGDSSYARLLDQADHDALLYGEAPVSAGAGQRLLESRIAAAPDGAWLVWFKQGAYTDNLLGFGSAWLRAAPLLEMEADLADSVIYRIRKNAAPGFALYRAALRAARQSASRGSTSREAGGFDVSWRGGELVYVKESCSGEDARRRFMLHVYPADAADLPAARKIGGYAFDNLSFYFTEHGVVLEGACVTLYPLPGYAIERIEMGQYALGGEGLPWRAALRPERTVASETPPAAAAVR